MTAELVHHVFVFPERLDRAVGADDPDGVGSGVSHVEIVRGVPAHTVAIDHPARGLGEDVVGLHVTVRAECDFVNHAVAEQADEEVAMAVELDAVGSEAPVVVQALERGDDVRVVLERGLELDVLFIKPKPQHRAGQGLRFHLQRRLRDIDVAAVDGDAVGHIEPAGNEHHLVHFAGSHDQPPEAGRLVLVLHEQHVGQVEITRGRGGNAHGSDAVNAFGQAGVRRGKLVELLCPVGGADPHQHRRLGFVVEVGNGHDDAVVLQERHAVGGVAIVRQRDEQLGLRCGGPGGRGASGDKHSD